MKIYEDREKNKRHSFCRFCGKRGHLWVSCKVPAQQLKLKVEGKQPDFSLFSDWYAKQFNHMENGVYTRLDYMYGLMERQFIQQFERNERLKKRKQQRESLYGKRRRAPKCGFCGEKGHNRRNCEVKRDFVNDLIRANQAYRKRWFNEVVQKMGVAEGALVSVTARQAHMKGQWIDDFEGIGIISKIEWDKVNMGLGADHWDYRSDMAIHILIDGETIVTKNFFANLIATNNYEVDNNSSLPSELSSLYAGRSGGWGMSLEDVLAPSQSLPTEEWFNETYSDCWEYIVKNKSLSGINQTLGRMIATFHPSRRGRNAGKFKKRLAQYGYNAVK